MQINLWKEEALYFSPDLINRIGKLSHIYYVTSMGAGFCAHFILSRRILLLITKDQILEMKI
ncbi:MAG: hypothetical protein ACI4U5_06025 [Bacilli bacterium]